MMKWLLVGLMACGCYRMSEPEWPEGRPEGDYSETCWSEEVTCHAERQMVEAHKAWRDGETVSTEGTQSTEDESRPSRAYTVVKSTSDGLREYSRTMQRLQEQQKLDNIQRDLDQLKWQQSTQPAYNPNNTLQRYSR
jgi:hypothetical protein